MKITFSEHALSQLKNRGIVKTKVIEAINNPDEKLASFRNRQLYRKKFENNWLEIVVIKEDNEIIVITQYFLEQ